MVRRCRCDELFARFFMPYLREITFTDTSVSYFELLANLPLAADLDLQVGYERRVQLVAIPVANYPRACA